MDLFQNRSIKVLLVEDDVFLVELLERKLKEYGIKTFPSSTSYEALFILEKEKIDAILLDIILPDTNGLSFLKDLKENPKFKDIPIIIISNLGQKDEIQKGLDAGADSYLVKANVTTEEIVSCVQKMIKLHHVFPN